MKKILLAAALMCGSGHAASADAMAPLLAHEHGAGAPAGGERIVGAEEPQVGIPSFAALEACQWPDVKGAVYYVLCGSVTVGGNWEEVWRRSGASGHAKLAILEVLGALQSFTDGLGHGCLPLTGTTVRGMSSLVQCVTLDVVGIEKGLRLAEPEKNRLIYSARIFHEYGPALEKLTVPMQQALGRLQVALDALNLY